MYYVAVNDTITRSNTARADPTLRKAGKDVIIIEEINSKSRENN